MNRLPMAPRCSGGGRDRSGRGFERRARRRFHGVILRANGAAFERRNLQRPARWAARVRGSRRGNRAARRGRWDCSKTWGSHTNRPMKKILFICLGNICRSPMAEFVFRDRAAQRGVADRFVVASAATSDEEIGNPVHPGTARVLRARGVPMAPHRAARMTRADYSEYDLLLGMERSNLRQILRITGGDPDGKVRRLLDYATRPRDIADPWYTGDFDATYRDICEGCDALLDALLHERN